YDLLNEPAAPKPGEKQTEWLFGEFFGKYYGQRIALEAAGRSRQDIVARWIDQMVAAIRSYDRRHLITVGLLPPEFDSGFVPAQVAPHLDFLAVHIYPTAGKAAESLKIVQTHSAAKLLIIEEIYPLRASCEETMQFINDAGASASGWISFYWGETPDELSSSSQPGKQIQLQWLRLFTARGKKLNALP
ncbi:MAG TPA: hypothetical protein VM510_08850, partial [Caulifigura sp.]|nr:hypothetical protein [Caulifigura sp.]